MKEETICFKFCILYKTSVTISISTVTYMTQLVPEGNVEDANYKGTTTPVFMML